MESTPVVIESQLDWLTCSVEGTDKQERLRLSAHRLMAAEVVVGARVTPFRLNGYQGTQAGRVRFGERDDRALIQLSGDLAEFHFRPMHERADHISRLDLAVTVRYPVYQPAIGAAAYQDACQWRAGRSHSALPKLVEDGDGGTTFYLGDRTSDLFLRVYNKQAECQAHDDQDAVNRYHNCWRYELEVKGVTAPGVAERVFDSPAPSATIRALLHNHLVAHGIRPTWDFTTPEQRLPGFRRRSDRDTRLRWLERSVRPAVDWLLENGDRTEVLQRLGLVDLDLLRLPPTAEQPE